MEFDKEAIYDKEINPLMKQIIDICKKNEIPVIASFCYKSTEGEDSFCTTCIPIGEWLPDAFKDCRKRLFSNPGILAFTITTERK
jgi:hypothetical protein